jgi:RNA polymerase sigma-70 factor (ECF subfamily)
MQNPYVDRALDLARIFVLELPKGCKGDALALSPGLADLLTVAAERWPTLKVDPESFIRFLAAKIARGEVTPEVLRKLHTTDLYLAFACKNADRKALALFDKHFLSDLPRHIAHLISQGGVDEVCQLMRERLFGTQGAKIADYTGRGPLGAWLRVAAIRTTLNLLAAEKRHHPKENPPGRTPLPLGDPELDTVRAEHGRYFRRAFEDSTAALSEEERSVLRMHFLEGMTVREIGRLFQVDGSTVSRWIDRSRKRLLADTRALLGQRLRLADEEVESLMGIAKDDFALSLSRILRRKPK